MKKNKKVPVFKNEKEEFEFWARHDSTEYLDYSKGKKTLFPNLKPSIKTISLRLPESFIEYFKILAHKRDVPYQSLIKMFLAERLKKELNLAEV
ncbi:MAG: BrnA antitoxin family protein [Candidatus Margulisbacteria bacterium]|nr:BrnA antitoxin family protein [Candidatus Margulisiibacteriota bacterium]